MVQKLQNVEVQSTSRMYKIDIKKILNRHGKYLVWADGTMSTTEDQPIYFAKNLQVGLFDNLTYDFGGDPALDSF